MYVEKIKNLNLNLSIIRSYTFPMLLDTVIPLSFEHLPFFPFPLYSRVIIPLRHSSGMFFLMCTMFVTFVVYTVRALMVMSVRLSGLL